MAHPTETWDLDDPAVDLAINRVLTAERLAHAELADRRKGLVPSRSRAAPSHREGGQADLSYSNPA